jgi:muconate cycloisomerase
VSSATAEVDEAKSKVADGHRIFKIKTAAHPLAEDLRRVEAIRAAVGPMVALRVDANQGWDRPTALKAIRALAPFDLDFVEQPLPRWDLEGMAELGRRVEVPLMADESCFSPHDALAIARLGGVGILGLKVTKSAGLLETMAIARIAEAAGLGGYVGCMIETSLGTAAYLQIALAATPVTWGCELFGPLLLAGDVTREPVRYADGAILALDGPGLGVEVDESALKATGSSTRRSPSWPTSSPRRGCRASCAHRAPTASRGSSRCSSSTPTRGSWAASPASPRTSS